MYDAVIRRAREELGLKSIIPNKVFDFIYRASFRDMAEYEFDHAIIAQLDNKQPLNPDKNEISAKRWISNRDLEPELVEHPENFTSRFLILAPRVLSLNNAGSLKRFS